MSDLPSGHRLMAVDEIPDPGGQPVELDGNPVLVVRSGDTVKAYMNVCPHAGRPLCLPSGRTLVRDEILVCPFHGASFDVKSGQCVGGPAGKSALKSVPITIQDGQIHTA